ncbi:MAG: hypothetical protein ACLVK8_09715, partial [Ruminococcus sp.]
YLYTTQQRFRPKGYVRLVFTCSLHRHHGKSRSILRFCGFCGVLCRKIHFMYAAQPVLLPGFVPLQAHFLEKGNSHYSSVPHKKRAFLFIGRTL